MTCTLDGDPGEAGGAAGGMRLLVGRPDMEALMRPGRGRFVGPVKEGLAPVRQCHVKTPPQQFRQFHRQIFTRFFGRE